MTMQQQPERQRRSSQQQPQLDSLREAAISRLQEGMQLVVKYREELRNLEVPGVPQQRDEIDKFIEKEIFPFYVGPPGRICDECGGSGRKKD